MADKHTPNTCEPSVPHPSPSTDGKEHVDMIHFGSDGQKDNALTKEYSHITDQPTIDYAKDFHKNR